MNRKKLIFILLIACFLAGITAAVWAWHARAAADAAFTELLRSGVTEHGIEINYYAYLDLEKDGTPELLVSDCPGTENDWSTGALYGYEDGLVCYGTTSTHFDHFYLANDAYLLARHRMGAQFFGKKEKIITVVYHIDEDQNRCDPAIQLNDGDWTYLTEEEYSYYNLMPQDDPDQQFERFIETAIPIELQPNMIKANPQDRYKDDTSDLLSCANVRFPLRYSLQTWEKS